MKDLIKCSLDELLTERQLAIESGNLSRYRECNELISTMHQDLKNECELNSLENQSVEC